LTTTTYTLNIKSMKYTGNTVSKPVVGKEAEALSQAIKTGSYVANDQAWVTINRITDKIRTRNKAISK
jgi:hypothetical protein